MTASAIAPYQAAVMATTTPASAGPAQPTAPGGSATANRLPKNTAAFGFAKCVTKPRRNAARAPDTARPAAGAVSTAVTRQRHAAHIIRNPVTTK